VIDILSIVRRNHTLGERCEAITVAYKNSDQPDRATLYHQHATNAYKRTEQTAVVVYSASAMHLKGATHL